MPRLPSVNQSIVPTPTLDRGRQIAALTQELREAGLRGAHASELAEISKRHMPNGLLSLGEFELGDGPISGPAAWDAPHIIGKANEQYQSRLGRAVKEAADAGGSVPDEYLDFLLNAGVAEDTVQDVASGNLPMDTRSRAARAMSLGVNPGRRLYRVDAAGKTEFRGRARHGLVYAGLSPELAKEASQAGFSQTYPLVTSGRIAGLPEGDRASRRLVDASSQGIQRLKSASNNKLMGHASPPPQLRPGWQSLGINGYSYRTPELLAPMTYGELEQPGAANRILRQGFGGTLVRDEAGISAAIATPTIRHSFLSVLDPRHVNSRNILQGLLVPVAVGAAAGQEDR